MADDEIEQDVAALKEFVEALLDLTFEGQIEMKALQRAVVERHGLSLETLSEYRAQEKAKVDALRLAEGNASQVLKRFQGPEQ
jgi:hypothetical protein